MIMKFTGEVHKTVKFEGKKSESDHLILPGKDNCGGKLKRFRGAQGDTFENVAYTVDETVYIVQGLLEISQGGSSRQIGQGGSYFVPAGESYDVRIIWDTIAVCFFSLTPENHLPDDK